MMKVMEQHAFGSIVLQGKSHFPLRTNHMFDLYRETLKSYLDLIYQSRSCDIRESAEFNGDGRSFLHANHEQTHTEMKFHKSSKPIRTKSQSLKIPQTHRIENTYECTESGKAIFKKPQLMEHKIIHTGKKTHGCSVYGMQCPRSSSSLNISTLTVGRNLPCANLMHAASVGKPFSGNFSLLNIKRAS